MNIDGSEPGSYPSLGDITLKIWGRTNPARRVAEACIPGEPQKKSIISPVKKEIIRRSHEGISNGRRRMNIIYI
jgi:hypothetical protein